MMIKNYKQMDHNYSSAILRLCLVWMIIFFIHPSYAQKIEALIKGKKNTSFVLLDEKGVLQNVDFLKAMKSDDWVQFRFSEMNPLLYKYEISVNDTIKTLGQKPELFSILSMDKFSTLVSSITEQLSAQDGSTTTVLGSLTKSPCDIECLNCSIPLLQSFFPNLIKALEDSIRANIALEPIVCEYHTLLKIQTDYIDSIKVRIGEVNEALLDFNISKRKWRYDDEVKFNFDISLFKMRLLELKLNNNQLGQNISDLNKSQEPNKKIFGELGKGMVLLNKKIANDIITLDTILSFDNYAKQLAEYHNYKENSSYTTMPFKVGSLGKDISLKISPYDDEFAAPSYEMDLSIRPKNMISFGFSSGFYVSTLHDDRYSSIGMDSTFYPVEEVTSSFEIGLNALAHLRFGSGPVKFQVGMGPALAIKKTLLPGFAAGLGVTIGEKRSIVISTGCNVGYIKRKSNILNEQTSFEGESTNFTVDVLKAGWFVSIGYNFL